jgi:UDP-N-acetylmuramyl pentapeptide phosphotransferase/UDP-N-acetylglucosamine-1-phosphate transferase
MSVAGCGLLILGYPALSHRLRKRNDLSTVQAAHVRETPRLGGFPIMGSFLVALLFLAPDEWDTFYLMFAVTLAPVFLAGFIEDLGWRVSANGRLGAALASAVLAVLLLNIWLPSFGLPVFDHVLGFMPAAILVTLLWTTGVCHAFNLIDGVNGLAGSTALMIALAIATVAQRAGADGFATVAAAMVPALAGFLLFNWPLGRLFMGDAGAYTLGHVLVWLSIGLAYHYSTVSAVALALMFFWPVADTLLAMYRRRRSGRPFNAPDRLHYHQLVMRALILVSHGRMPRGVANSATTLALLPFVAAPILTAVALWDRPVAALAAWAVFGMLFTASYMIGMCLFRGPRWRRVARLIGPRKLESSRPARIERARPNPRIVAKTMESTLRPSADERAPGQG